MKNGKKLINVNVKLNEVRIRRDVETKNNTMMSWCKVLNSGMEDYKLTFEYKTKQSRELWMRAVYQNRLSAAWLMYFAFCIFSAKSNNWFIHQYPPRFCSGQFVMACKICSMCQNSWLFNAGDVAECNNCFYFCFFPPHFNPLETSL